MTQGMSNFKLHEWIAALPPLVALSRFGRPSHGVSRAAHAELTP